MKCNYITNGKEVRTRRRSFLYVTEEWDRLGKIEPGFKNILKYIQSVKDPLQRLKNWDPCNKRVEEILFFDTETTGLSKNEAMAFIGFSRLTQEGVTLNGLFARDYSEEESMLEEFKRTLERNPLLFSYNGNSFDKGRLEDRMLVHGVLKPRFKGYLKRLIDERHIDLYQEMKTVDLNLPDLKLQTVEDFWFGAWRKRDLPGEKIPQVYQDYLYQGETSEIERMMKHCLLDTVSLIAIALKLLQEKQDLFKEEPEDDIPF